MRKLVVLSVVAMVFLALGTGVALADDARIQCKSVPCYASGDDDLVLERMGNGKQDEIIVRGGNDLVRANRYTDDKDVVEGGLGDDRIYVDDGDKLDTANAGQGRSDVCYVDARSEAGQGCGKVIVR
jgi:gamma-glutamyl phosphate reductase